MVTQEGAVMETIKTYIIGGEEPAEESPEGTLNDEREVLKIAASEKIEGVLFNQAEPDDDMESLSVVLTPELIYVSKEDLFHVTGSDDGISLFEEDGS
jgi:hypothetical protein